jgi:hypothetical protein
VSRSQLNLRIPPEEKQQLREEAASYGISMSALVRINNLTARESRERVELRRKAYPDKIGVADVSSP